MQLLQHPNEILSRVISFLDTPSPFDADILQKPKSALIPFESEAGIELTSIPASLHRQHTLKNLTLTCRFLRALTLPVLFKHAVLHPLLLTDFLSFLKRHDLSQHVVSVVAHVPGHYNHIHPAWWARLLNEVPATRFSIVAAPEIFAELAGICSWTSDAWAFDMAFQILRLDQTPEAAQMQIDYDDLPNFLVARPWQNMVVNEGSSLMAYTTYEFFLRRTPSLLTALHSNNSAAGDVLFANLRSFDFVAIFPFYNHVDEVLKCVRKMRQLRRLFVKLCPEPSSTVFHDEIEMAGGALDIHDPWNECETSWTLIAHSVVFLTTEGQLCELQMDDVKVEGMRQTLEQGISSLLEGRWLYEEPESGIWRRRRVPGCLQQG
ncbi:uncharacterized protein PV07_12268 [Cladophialophora immunda]|uniref:F-box domain-containing protein n=1 Tax=Cladophialophora immunda TaxID=569365 RepID=A0A0D2BTK4_9EURO|nr:uncharacterized protein PV07_12268 [Cladophialophora immunda]KIW22378.1 hypothetical protein PV07_12268 [Cladophialophora immunda]OQU98153.1 hypothetical protein CLAIMM_03978 isoform 1 [Cladophialophora immunda]OQU98154.1 hypothetical protein CLAIMM_03978 isoform 2 [Cladophialophora immunda]